jgi:hypothetical protein
VQEHGFVSLLIIKPTCVVIDLASPQVLLVDGRIDTVQSSSSLAAQPPAHPVRKSPHPFFLLWTRSRPCPLSCSFFFRRASAGMSTWTARPDTAPAPSLSCARTQLPRPLRHACPGKHRIANSLLAHAHAYAGTISAPLRFTRPHACGDKSQSPAPPTDARRGGVCRPQAPTR